MADIRQVALTWRQVLAILLLFPTLGFLFAASAVYRDEPEAKVHSFRIQMSTIAAICGTLSASLFIWNYLIARQPDVHPDILAQLFGEESVFEMDTLHFWAMGRQRGGTVRILILLQNVYGGQCTGRLQLNPVGTTTKIPNAKAPIEFTLDNAEVLACWRDLPVPVTGELSFSFDGFIRKVRAPRVRFKRRIAIRSDSAATAMTVLALAGGHIHISSASRLNIKLENPPADALATIPPGEWETVSLWSLQDQRKQDDVMKLLEHLWNG